MSFRGFGVHRKNSARYCEPNTYKDSQEERFSNKPHCAKRRKMDDDVDPGPALRQRSASTNRNARGRGWRSYSGQRSEAGIDWRRNRPDIPPLIGLNLNPRQYEARPQYQPQSHRGGRAGFRNVNTFGNRSNAGIEQNQPNAHRRDEFNHRRGNPNMRFDRNTESNGRSNNVKFRKRIGFKWLEEIAQSDHQDALTKLTENKTALIELIQSPIERYDVFVLVVGCMAKVCQSSFDELKLNLLRDICNSNFIVSLKSYLMDLPYPKAKAANSLYWKDQDGFWINLITFFESIIYTSPTLALDKCRSLVEGISTASLDGLKEKHSYVLPEELTNKLKDLRETMDNFEKMKVAEKKSRRQFVPEAGSPPEDFRELSVMPTRDDLLVKRPFIRPNIVDGAYQDVEHYLDVQFRLLREDCFGPLREGLNQYIEDPKRKRYDHIRIVHNVKFVKPFVSQTKIGSFVQIDFTTNKHFKRINWRNSKRFIFGSLVLFTKDNCKSFLVGTILDREEKYLMEGLIPVSLMGGEFNERLYNDEDSYTMIESEVYFEPYFHVLRALQDRSFPEHIAMKQYIVDVNPEPKPPAYLQPDSEFVVILNEKEKVMLQDCDDEYEISSTSEYDSEPDEVDIQVNPEDNSDAKSSTKTIFTVLQEDTWPDNETLQFNESQFDAYKLALTHEFAVIQGPPGTGKTYLGIKVAKTLYKNLKKKEATGCLMLVICYTNHALDQVLEALLKVTNSIARIGGQSRNEAMDPINITKLRRNVNSHSEAQHVFASQKTNLKAAVTEFQNALVELDVLLNGVMKSRKLMQDIPEVVLLSKFYNAKLDQDALYRWLFEHYGEYYVDIEELFLENENGNAYAAHEKETRKRTGVHLDDQEMSESEQMTLRARISSFTLEDTNLKLKELVKTYNECPEPNEKREILAAIRYLALCKELFIDMSQYRSRRINVEITENTNFNRFTPADRWSLYFMWIHNETLEKRNEIGMLQANVEAASTAYEEARMLLDMQVLKNKKVVGMTTSGAARMRKLLQTLAPPIVIVEEAAEVLEQHIITSLTKSCQHLILIGDHQQLRPSASHMRLAKHYNIEVSLFERMIANGIHSRRLGVQHRMRPEIAELICPHIYTDLQNHPSVYDFPDVLGVTKNLFFFTHEHREQEVVENMSRTNEKEGDLVLALANYLMQQGYTADDVTILAAYKGQMFYMRKESEKYTHLTGVKITVVDNYQGEESKIILLSLVRNNEENRIGFLGTANRICVALSRAKEGFYIFGNIENLKANSELWQSIATTLENGDSIGTSLTLKCQNHVNNLTTVSNVSDFEEVPEGGCKALCGAILRHCGHKCLLFCHGYDRDHSTNYTRCPKKCERVLCVLGHVCPKKCAQECGPCMELVKKMLPCGHEAQIHCHLDPDDDSVKCYTPVEVKLPHCGHMAQKLCYSDIKKVQCLVKCDYRIEQCGHTCMRNCHVTDDPEHAKYICKKACARAKIGCTAQLQGNRGEHQCLKKCYETCDECCVMVNKKRTSCNHNELVTCITNVDEKRCLKKCPRKLPCDHFCKKKCWELCGNCKEMVTKEIPDCKHKTRIFCNEEPKRANCTLKCERTMSCGHKCTGLCKNACDPSVCTKLSDRKVEAPCGHKVTLPCNMAALTTVEEATLVRLCTAPCGAELACGHVCSGSCGACRRGALHVACTQTCHQPNICGHECEEPCNQICPPCKKPCEVRCQHSRCRKLCGAPCTSCKEPCTRGCTHGGQCQRRCGEPCSRRACDEPCSLQLACGHPCRGVCGEPCPPVCKTCDPDGFPLDFLGDEFDDDAKFILLQDCGHVMEVENMDNLMMGDRDTVEIRKCPLCRKPIINTRRYKDLVNAIFKREINPIKVKIYGTEKQIQAKKKVVYDKILEFRDKYFTVLNASTNIRKVYLNLQTLAKTTQKVSKIQLDMLLVCLNILDMISECHKSYKDDKLTEMMTDLEEQTRIMCDVFTFRVNAGVMLKISEQQQRDMNREIKRLSAIVQLAKLMQNGSYASVTNSPAAKRAHDSARAAVLSWTAFDEDRAIAMLNTFREVLKVTGVVSKQERDLIVKAMGMKAGAWYKCPNGHFYCIGECGGAMEESKCPDCGERIGGRSHALTTGNAHAGEIDGSRAPAWPIHNDMANYRL